MGQPAAAPVSSAPVEGAWGGAWGPPATVRGPSSEGQALAKQSAWGKPSPASAQQQAHLQPSAGQPVPVPGLAGGAVDSLPPHAHLDKATVVVRGLLAASPQQSPASSLVASPLSVPAIPSGPLPGALPSAIAGRGAPGVLTAAEVVAAGAALGGASTAGEGRHVVRCKGLPFSATVASVASFFEPLVLPRTSAPPAHPPRDGPLLLAATWRTPWFASSLTSPQPWTLAQDIIDGGVYLQMNADGAPSGECFVEFGSLEVRVHSAAASRRRAARRAWRGPRCNRAAMVLTGCRLPRPDACRLWRRRCRGIGR
jgi:hypothetical protein